MLYVREGGQCERGDIVPIWKALLRMKPMKEVSQPMGVKYQMPR